MAVGVGQTVAIQPPTGVSADQVSVGNAATGDLQVLSEDPSTYSGGDNWLVVSPGYDHAIGAPVSRSGQFVTYRFAADTPALWVRYASPSDSGTVVLIWL